MILENDSSILETHETYFPQLQQQIQRIKELHQQKQWHQLTDCLQEYIKQEEFQKGDVLIDFYNNFIKGFEIKLNQQKVVIIAMQISEKFYDFHDGVSFLQQLKDRFIIDKSAQILIEIKQGILKLQDAEKYQFECLDIFQKNLILCQNIKDLEWAVFSNLYKLGLMYYQFKQNNELYYKYALQYIAYTPEDKMQENEKLTLCIKMALTILISKKIFNFSELLEQPVIRILDLTDKKWIYQMLKIFNEGNVQEYEQFLINHQNLLNQYREIQLNQDTLNQKIKLMAFLQLAFSLPKNNRKLNYHQIQQISKLENDDQVEQLIMKAMSLELIKGKIDQIQKNVQINYIVPQVLDKERIKIMKNKINVWCYSLNKLSKVLSLQMENQ